MAEAGSRAPMGKVVVGALLIAAGAGVLGVIFAAIYNATPELASFGFRLGLAFGALVSGLAQMALVAGIWMIWSSLRRRRS